MGWCGHVISMNEEGIPNKVLNVKVKGKAQEEDLI
jgi:hypothetical protein